MAVKVILALSLSLFFISQVSNVFKNNQETIHVSQTFHVFNRGESAGGRKLMHNIVPNLSRYFQNRPSLRIPALAPAPAPTLVPNFDCGTLCKCRCSQHSRQNVCMRACGTCCIRCKCVPPGTFGNREMCGKCYTDMTTHGNKTKCP